MKIKRKLYFFIPFLVLVLIFSFALACNGSSGEIDVKYIVAGYTGTEEIKPEVSVTYSNSQGGTEQKNGLVLKKDLASIFNELGEYYDFEGIEKWSGEIIAHYSAFPKNEFLYISAQNQKSYGAISVFILVNNTLWKHGVSTGEYCITDANGYYGLD